MFFIMDIMYSRRHERQMDKQTKEELTKCLIPKHENKLWLLAIVIVVLITFLIIASAVKYTAKYKEISLIKNELKEINPFIKQEKDKAKPISLIAQLFQEHYLENEK